MKYQYRLLITRHDDTLCYGICARWRTRHQWEQVVLEDITTDLVDANQLLALVMRYRVTPNTLQNVVEDWLEQQPLYKMQAV